MSAVAYRVSNASPVGSKSQSFFGNYFMKQFRACFCIASMIGLFGCVTNVFAAEFPLKAKALVGEFEKNMKQTRKAFASELQEWRNAVVLELKSVQKQLAEVEKLDEAIPVRDVVRSLEAEAGKELTSVVERERFGKLPKDAQKILLKLESPGSVEGRMEKAFVEQMVQLLKNLAEMQTLLTKNNMLDEAVAVLDWLRANALPTKSGSVIPMLARDTQAIEKRLAFDILLARRPSRKYVPITHELRCRHCGWNGSPRVIASP